MEDGEVELSNQARLSDPLNFPTEFHGSTLAADTFFDDFLKSMQSCTHTHTCNPPGPDAAHTHTCYHSHTQVFTSEEDDVLKSKQESGLKSRRSSGNRKAVRKYREKKKAHTAYLEEEVKKLHVLNQQLVKKLQGQAMLEAEVVRLRSLLMDLRGKIDTDLGVFPLQKQFSSIILKEGDCRVQSTGAGIDLQCEPDIPCFHPHISSSLQVVDGNTKVVMDWEGSSERSVLECQEKQNGAVSQNLANVNTNLNILMMNSTIDMDRTLVAPAFQTE